MFAFAWTSLAGCCQSGQDNPPVKPEPAAQNSAPAASALPAISAAASANPAPSAIAPQPAPRIRPLGTHQIAALIVRPRVKHPAVAENHTRFLQSDGTSKSRKGAHVFINGALHRFKQQEKKTANPKCEGDEVNLFPFRIFRNAEFVPEKKGTALEVIKFYKAEREGEFPVNIDHEIVAALPGYTFLKTSITDYGCGAHPLYASKFTVVIWSADGTFEEMNTPEYTEGSETGLDKAIAKFDSQVSPSEPDDSLDGKVKRSEVTVSMAYPTWSSKGADWTVLYSAPATWAGSFGGWAGYTRSLPIVLDQPPARFREVMVVPDVVATYIGQHEKDEDIVGFTLGETDLEKK
ncbi:MAG TPA: hypothetical protein PK156_07800 [Polyangium sp.]|nr:hypothetical protein [Polyangium sp.]